MATNFIEQYTKLFGAITDAPENLLEAVAIFILSTAIGRNWYISSVPDQIIFSDNKTTGAELGKPMNVWFIIVGKTRLSRKTTVVNKAKEIFDMLKIHTIPDAFSPEALVTDMTNSAHAAWVLDECSGFFESARKSDYMAAAEAMLSRLYDCRTYSRRTKKQGLETIENPYLTAFLASTLYLPSVFTDRMFKQGFLNRFIFVHAENKNRRAERQKPLTAEEIKVADNIIKYLKTVFNVKAYKIMHFTPEAKVLVDAFEADVDKMIEKSNNPNRVDITYAGGLPNVIKRLAGLHRVARMDEKEVLDDGGIGLAYHGVEKQDAEWAIAYGKRCITTIKEIIEFRDEYSQDARKDMGDYRTNKEKMLDAIRRISNKHNTGFASLTKLNNLCGSHYGWLAEDRNKILESLKDEGRIKEEQLDTGGRKTTIIKLIPPKDITTKPEQTDKK